VVHLGLRGVFMGVAPFAQALAPALTDFRTFEDLPCKTMNPEKCWNSAS
jgi:hypothetical protein